MKRIFTSALLLWGCLTANAQLTSPFKVNYMVTFDEETKSYTTWVVPDYDTPNIHNADTEEKGATAQVTLKVPKGFVLSNLRDIRGTWEKKPVKLGSEPVFRQAGSDSRSEYYVIGKAPVETNYGSFRKDEPVALFSFTGTVAAAEVKAIENSDPFIHIADEMLSLNVGSSFYSRSGQRPTVTSVPLEQFSAPINRQTMLTKAAEKAGMTGSGHSAELNANAPVITYPNPVSDVLTVRYFSEKENAPVRFELIDARGNVISTSNIKAKLGFTTVQMNVGTFSDGAYLIRTVAEKQSFTHKVVKVN
ncbi:T9SS type A sorting domain-containing protein [Runella slithyformis]|uniref:Secretion system C-terminal sorting domain-containing protein n=1 Tax=Runella slithyformis (strain ATCC 29530 / DSM 19594 / LMG 11500 / NCIMB 11436 / LSU 4) TaxID=761193 RepID=A0A7U4E8J8_RUNSL|nr:T9SS type A sorting domain-containing protein [Runella slithyformis]AEI51418.1 hypothetical protein Runsl_5116 [Runella slithyformis DSM 19594]